MPKRIPAAIAVALSCACAIAPAGAQGYPVRPVRFIVPFPAGGGADILARIVAARLSETWRQQVVVDNRPGASGIVGTDLAAKASPDGYTALLASSNLAITEGMEGRRPYGLLQDLVPVVRLASAPNMLVANPAVKAASVMELVAAARARPDSLRFASNGNGSSSHLSAELFNHMAGIKMVHVPYKGGPPGVTATIAGETQIMFTAVVHVTPHARAGRLRALGVTGASRSPTVPEVPTIAEQGLKGYESVQWWMVMFRTGTPGEIQEKWNDALLKMLRMPDTEQRFSSQGAEPIGSTPGEAREYLRLEVRKWAGITKALGLKLQ